MPELFNRKTEFGGSFRGNELVINFAGFNAGYLINQVSANYNAPITRIRELGSKRVFFISGDGSGTLQIGRVTGPSSSVSSLIRAYSDVCSIAQNVLTMAFANGACSVVDQDPENGLTFEGVLLQQWNLNASSQQGNNLITTAISGSFENLEDDSIETDLSDTLNTASNIAASLGQ